MLRDVKYNREKGEVVITLGVLDEMYETGISDEGGPGKNLMFATSHGYQGVPVVLNIKDKSGADRKFPLKVSCNAIVTNPDYVKPKKALN